MSEIVKRDSRIVAMTDDAIDKVRALEAVIKTVPQESIHTQHILHGGIYSRTIKAKADTVLTGVLIKVPTILTISGDCTVFVGDEVIRVAGYNVVAASAKRKQAFVFHEDTFLTMSFATDATTIGEAEEQFTDEAHLLMSRMDGSRNSVIITGE